MVEAFPTDPIMLEVARCESGVKQHDKNGKVIMNTKTNDKGIFQINEIHWPKAKQLGYDLDTFEGNIKMAQYILKTQGLNAWYSSVHCWLAKT